VNGERDRIFGVVLAGGASRRFGRPKALAEVAGVPLARWSVDALVSAGLPVGVVTADVAVGAALRVPSRPDLEPGLGPIGGLWTALEWARERGETAVFLLGCDMPLVTEELIRLIIARRGSAAAVAPRGPSGLQPLCALYHLACLPEVETGIRSRDWSLHGLLAAVEAQHVSESEVATVVRPETAFWNVNTEDDGARAAELLAATPRSGP